MKDIAEVLGHLMGQVAYVEVFCSTLPFSNFNKALSDKEKKKRSSSRDNPGGS